MRCVVQRNCRVKFAYREPLHMSWLAKRLQLAAVIPLACAFTGMFAGTASAHVKWFCAFDVAGQPEGLENVLCPDFEWLVGLSLLTLMAGALFEGTAVGIAMLRSLDRVTRFARDNIETIFRAACAFFFI